MSQAQLQFDDPDLTRVTSRIGRLVMDFCRERTGRSFYARELQLYVVHRSPSAPASADRILRALAQRKQLSYTVVDRPKSLYRVNWVASGATQLEYPD